MILKIVVIKLKELEKQGPKDMNAIQQSNLHSFRLSVTYFMHKLNVA